jgi:hypothetical protein
VEEMHLAKVADEKNNPHHRLGGCVNAQSDSAAMQGSLAPKILEKSGQSNCKHRANVEAHCGAISGSGVTSDVLHAATSIFATSLRFG